MSFIEPGIEAADAAVRATRINPAAGNAPGNPLARGALSAGQFAPIDVGKSGDEVQGVPGYTTHPIDVALQQARRLQGFGSEASGHGPSERLQAASEIMSVGSTGGGSNA